MCFAALVLENTASRTPVGGGLVHDVVKDLADGESDAAEDAHARGRSPSIIPPGSPTEPVDLFELKSLPEPPVGIERRPVHYEKHGPPPQAP